MPTLHVLQGPDKGRTYETPDEPALIGRSAEHIQLSDDSTSRRHAELRPHNGSWYLVDLNSSNGTFLNGRRIVSPTPIKHGDQIKVGSTLLVFNGQEKSHGRAAEDDSRDLIDLDGNSHSLGASILSAVNTAEESVILQSPETADAVAAWNVVYQIAETIGTTDSIGALLEKIADIVFEYLIVDRLIILMPLDEGQKLSPQVVRRRKDNRTGGPQIVASRKIIQHVLKTREGVLCANAMSDERFAGDSNQDSIHRLGLRSVICVPILLRDRVEGVIHMDCSMSRHTYTHEQLRLAVAIGRLTGMAMENSRLLHMRMRNERLAATGETVAYLSHHIRNILQGLQGGAEVVELGMRKQDLNTARAGWNLVRSNLDRTLHLAMNMLTFSKDRQPKIEPVQLNRIVEDVISLAQKRADEHGTMILTDLEELPAIPLDAEGIHQVIHNILVNAIQAVPAGSGRVNIRTHYDPAHSRVTTTISDNGPGIPEADRERIFDVFHSSKGQGGSGLGLAAAKKIVSELRGAIDVESRPGEGTAFHIHLPSTDARLADSRKTHGPDALHGGPLPAKDLSEPAFGYQGQHDLKTH